ncbi:hypothetical protein [Trebonia sp.]|uniref:hypothetical protein n=1 Tax=Trebonia sp. TaxID=2767075 RepID=UPI00262BB431|nr:hypothetical protein [Trebonia sp.]
MNTDRFRRLAGRIAAVLAEMNEAQRRATVLRVAPDNYLVRPDEPPDSYAEFLARTSGPLLHEPPAEDRTAA